MGKPYDGDIVAWAFEQAALLRERNWAALDIENIAEEIESVGRSEKRELGSRMTVLLAHLLKWHFQPMHRSNSWLRTIRTQRQKIARAIVKMPSLRPCLTDPEWIDDAWEAAVEWAAKETGIDEFPEHLPWTVSEALDLEFLPD